MKRETVKIKTPFIKLSALLKFTGAAETGGRAKEMITGGKILLDGEICLVSGKKIYPGMVVAADGREYEVAAG